MVSLKRGIPPWDNANTLYIEREEIQGMLAVATCTCVFTQVNTFLFP